MVHIITDLALLVPAMHSVGHLRKDAHIHTTVASLLIVILRVVCNLFGMKTKSMVIILGACSRAALVLQKLPPMLTKFSMIVRCAHSAHQFLGFPLAGATRTSHHVPRS